MPFFGMRGRQPGNGRGVGHFHHQTPFSGNNIPLGNGPVKTLKDIKIGSSGMVLDINARGPLRRRFMDMGITRGTVIQVMKYAPLGDPMELRLRDYVLSIRKSEAELIIVQEV